MIRGIDLSNFDGELSSKFIDDLKSTDNKHVVIRASLESQSKQAIAQQQLRALTDGGFATSVYIWMYQSWDPVQTVRRTVDLVSGLPEVQFWLDCEELKDIGTAAQNISWIAHAVAEIGAQKRIPGIYTGAWWWQDASKVNNCRDFANLRLWAAKYDNIADLTVWVPFGGWASPIGKQYQGTNQSQVCGLAVDLDVFDDSYSAAPVPVAPAGASATTYSVQAGDTLTAIAVRSGISLAALEAANPRITNPNLIFLGQTIQIPAGH